MTTPTTAPWDHVYNDIRLALPGVTDALLQQVLFQVVKDFTDKTNIWQEEVPIAVVPNTKVYPFSVVDKGAPNRLLLLYDPSVQTPDPKWVETWVTMDKPGTIKIGYTPSSATTWNAVVAKTPIDPPTAQRYPDLGTGGLWFIDKYRDGLVLGVQGRLMMLPAKTFSNPAIGRQYYQFYISERSKARGDVTKANVFGGQRWMFPQGWATPHRGGWA